MGMFDYVDYECPCPDCEAPVTDFQSKDGDCTLSLIPPDTVSNFYGSCSVCGIWVEIDVIPARGVQYVFRDETWRSKLNKDDHYDGQ